MIVPAPSVFDAETHPIKAGMPAPRLVCLSVADDSGARILLRDEGLDHVERLLASERVANHHVFYDLLVCAAERPRMLSAIFRAIDDGRVDCTKITQMIIDNARGELKFVWDDELCEYKRQSFPLDRLVFRHLGRDAGLEMRAQKKRVDSVRLRYNEVDGVPVHLWRPEFRDYVLDDSVKTRAVWRSQQDRDIDGDEVPGLVSQVQAAWGLTLMSAWGLRTDPAAVREYRAELVKQQRGHVATCQEYGFRRSGTDSRGNPKKPSRDMKAIRAAIVDWYGSRGLRYRMTDGGKKPRKDGTYSPPQVATDREQLTDTDHPGLLAVAESVRVEKLLTTYVAALERGTEVPLNPSYNPIIETFRTSCSGGMKIDGVPAGMNVQNLPRGGRVRECVVPRPGWTFAFCDYDAIEMVTLAQVCLELFGFSEIANAVAAGLDPHLGLAAEIMGMPYGQVRDAYASGDARAAEVRQFSKIGNYGCAGGMSAETLVKFAKNAGVEISREQAEKIHAGYRRRWPEVVQYFRYCSFLCDGGLADVVFPRSGMVRGNVRYTAVCNGFFQHRAAMGAKSAMYRVVRECYDDAGSPLYGCRPWLFAHDEVGMEVPPIGPRLRHLAALRLQEVMVEAMREWCPDVTVKASVVLGNRWYKGAKPSYRDGYLAPSVLRGDEWVPDDEPGLARAA